MKSIEKPFYRKWWFILIVIIAIICAVGSIKSGIRNAAEKKSTYTWPDSALAGMIPKPDSKYGKIDMENEKYFSIDIYRTSAKQYEKYIEDCKNNGFTVDYSRFDDYYSAENENEDSLMLNYNEKEKTLSISLRAYEEEIPSEEQNGHVSPAEPKEDENSDGDVSTDEADVSQQAADTESNEEAAPPEQETSEGIRPEFKEVLDSYEIFVNDYCEFMKNYAESDDSLSMLQDYTRLVQEELEWAEKISDLEDTEMNDAEAKYYVEVTLRVSKKLIEASL